MIAFVDTNVVIEYLVGVDPDMRTKSEAMFARVQTGELVVSISATVILETCWVLTQRYSLSREIVRNSLADIVLLPGLSLEHQDVVLDALDLWVKETPLSFADCYHLLYARHLGLTQIYTFDRKMNRLPGLARVEP